jgi:purine catabolism regulator
MMEARAIAQVEQRFSNEILFGLLSDNPLSQEQALQKAPQLGTKLYAPYSIILAGADLADGSLLMTEQNSVDSSLYAAKRYLRGMNARAVFWYRGSQLVIFYPLDPDKPRESSLALEGQLQEVAARIKGQHRFSVSFGISGAETELMNFRQAHDCAQQSFEMGHLLVGAPGGRVTHYEKLGLFRTMSLLAGRNGLDRFCQDTLGPLIDYDERQGTELLETLRVYLEMNQNASKAAKALFIHYNTLRYRLQCIDDIIGNALDDPQERLTIEVALQLYPHHLHTP